MRQLRKLLTASFAIAMLSSCGGGDSGPPPLSIAASSPPAGTTGVAYAGYTFTASGGTAPLSWTESGSPPPGLTMSASGQLSGKPPRAGTYQCMRTRASGNGRGGEKNAHVSQTNAHCRHLTVKLTFLSEKAATEGRRCPGPHASLYPAWLSADTPESMSLR